jgi:hypothetical protein
LAKPFQGNSAVQTRKKMMEDEEEDEAVKFQQKTDINFFYNSAILNVLLHFALVRTSLKEESSILFI